MAKKKKVVKKVKTKAEALADDGLILVKFLSDAGLNGRMFTTGQEAYLTEQEYDTLHRCVKIIEEK